MIRDPEKDIILVNQILGKEASIGNLIPTSQIIPWMIIILFSYTITQGFFSLGMPWFFAISFWLIVSWWLLTGNHPHHFLNKFRSPPGSEWCNGHLNYIPVLRHNRTDSIRSLVKDSVTRVKLKPITKKTQSGQQQTYMPFQNFQDLVCLVSITKDRQTATGFLLNQGNQYQINFAFHTKGYHNLLHRLEITNTIQNLEEGFKEFPDNEKMLIHCGCFSDDSIRQEELAQLADQCRLVPVSIITRNEQKRVAQLTQEGIRQLWDSIIFCSWTFNTETGAASNDIIGRMLRFIVRTINKILGWFTGNEKLYQEQFFLQLLNNAFTQGFIPWQIFLDTQLGLEIKPCETEELWHWLWHQFNQNSPPAIPQLLSLQETEDGYQLQEIRNSDKDITTVLIEGHQGRSACPEHRGTGDCIWLPQKNQKVAIMPLERRQTSFTNQREQLRWLWSILSKTYIHDTKVVVELSKAPQFFIEENLSRQAKQSKSARERAFTQGPGRDAHAEIQAEESFQAQFKLSKGAKSFYVALTFLIYRPDDQQLNLACLKLADSLGSAKVIRERNIAWALWLETMPTTLSRLMHSSSWLSERRQVYDTETVSGILPLTTVYDLDRRGVEFISQGGKPIYIDLFHDHSSRALITGESGSGKSVLAWRFILEALVSNIPVVGIDISPGMGSTFKTAIELLGDEGAYYDITRTSSNLLEIPDLRSFTGQDRQDRLDQWKEFIRQALNAIVMGKVHDPKLSQRVDSLILKAFNIFLSDPDIIERYNIAFEGGWKSHQWQNIPVLSDFLKFVTKEQLNLQNFEAIDQAAINQIHSQITALLVSPLGASIGKPSNFSPTPAVKWFQLKGLNNEQDQYLMALNAHAACLRNALSYPQSLFVGEELSTLFRKDGFANSVGELCAVGRKNGISVLLLAQDIDSICDCSAGSQITQNIVYRLTGRLTQKGAQSWIDRMKYDPNIISQNASDSFLPRATGLYSNWLIETNNRYWQVRFYPGEMCLATVANNPAELYARYRVMEQYPKTLRGQMSAIKRFTQEYVQSLKQGKSLELIGQQDNYHNAKSA